jgi:hypothetical protein
LEQRETLGYENLDGSGQSYTVKAARQPQYFGANINPTTYLTTSLSLFLTASVAVNAESDFTVTLTLPSPGQPCCCEYASGVDPV